MYFIRKTSPRASRTIRTRALSCSAFTFWPPSFSRWDFQSFHSYKIFCSIDPRCPIMMIYMTY